MIKTITVTQNLTLTPEQIIQIEKAANMPITYDEDCPELTPDMEKAFRLAAHTRNRLKKGSVS